jgi:hypothetical protein
VRTARRNLSQGHQIFHCDGSRDGRWREAGLRCYQYVARMACSSCLPSTVCATGFNVSHVSLEHTVEETDGDTGSPYI